MKKRLIALSSLLALLVIVFASCSSPVKFDISFVSDGETIHTITTTGTEVIQMPQNPQKDGYTFGGWYWDNGTWQRPFTVNSILDQPLTSDMSVYAKWVPNGDVAVVEFVHSQEDTPRTESYIVSKGDTLGSVLAKMPNSERQGYRLAGWEDENGSIVSLDTVINGDITLYPIWQETTVCIDGTENHEWGEWQTVTTVASCTKDACLARSCLICGNFEYNILIKAYGHAFSADPIETYVATCKSGGYSLYKCTRCGDEEKRNETEPDPSKHQYEMVDTTATCMNSGYAIYSCPLCLGTKHEAVGATGHSFEFANTVKATCLAGGYDIYKCSWCETTENRNETRPDYSPNGHDYQPDIKEPTCTKTGYMDNVCTRCGVGDGNREYIPALKHTYERKDYDGVTGREYDPENSVYVYTCQECYETYEVPYEFVDTKSDKTQRWNGQTLDVLASGWGMDPAGVNSIYGGYNTGIWSQPELYVSSATDSRNMGVRINSAVWQRQEMIKTVYGVTVKWHRSASNTSMQNELQSGLEAGNSKYHIAMPRVYEAQSLIAADAVYDLANSKYIDLTKSYYSQAAVESFSVYGHTFFVAGDFSYLDEYTSYVIFYNQAMAEGIDNFPNLFDSVENGTWTISELSKLAQLVGQDDDGMVGYQDTDTYGFGTGTLSTFFQSSGIQQVSVDKSSGNKDTYSYHITLNDANVPTLVTELASIKTSTWARTSWQGGYSAMANSFNNGKLLFYHEVTQKIFQFPEQGDSFKVAVLPMPKLSTDQASYHTPFAAQGTVMCVPACTLNREMSEYFLDVLSWSGQDYVMNAFYEEIESKLYDSDNTEILKNYVFSNLSYDQGFMYESMGQRFMTSVQSETIANATPSSSPFVQYYTEAFTDAYDKLKRWNESAKGYKY